MHGGAKRSTPRPHTRGVLEAWRPARIAAGLPASAGRSYPGPRGKRTRFIWTVDLVVKALPVVPIDKPLEKWTHGEILADGARHGLLRLREVAMRPVEGDAWEQKLVLQASESLTKLYAHVQVEQLRYAAEQEDWAAYQKELEREARALGVKQEALRHQQLDGDAPLFHSAGCSRRSLRRVTAA